MEGRRRERGCGEYKDIVQQKIDISAVIYLRLMNYCVW